MDREKINNVLSEVELESIDGFFRAANYLSCAQLYLLKNPLLRNPLSVSDIKPRLVGHWGTVPGQTFIYTHLNRIIKEHDLNMLYVSGPGHGGNAIVSHVYMEGTYSEVYPNITEDEEGMKKTDNDSVFIGKPIEFDDEFKKLKNNLKKLLNDLSTGYNMVYYDFEG